MITHGWRTGHRFFFRRQRDLRELEAIAARAVRSSQGTLSAAAAADILGVAADVVTAREQPVSRADAARIEALITDLNGA